MGYSVKKGEHAALAAYIWYPKTKKAADGKDVESVEADGENNPYFVKVKAYLFGYNQVEKKEVKKC